MKLPKPLTLWHEIQSLFPDDIAELIHDIAKKLTPLIQNIKQVEMQGEMEPDGFNGLTKLVNYDRLLLTEWVLQDQFPDEFIRRAASGEHLFLDVQRVKNSHEKQCIVLFDCGPQQLGRPRLVQLALLILLARRANKENMGFSWGILQDCDCTLYDKITKNFIKAWLNQRSIIIPKQSHLDDWVYSLSSGTKQQNEEEYLAEQTTEFWLVTKNLLKPNYLTTQSIRIIEPLLNPDYIDVSFESKVASQSLSLKLIDEDLNVRVIRDPFNEAEVTQHMMTESHMGMWRISVNGLRIACFNNLKKLALYSFNKFKYKLYHLQKHMIIKENECCVAIHLTKTISVFITIDKSFIYIYEDNKSGKTKKIYRNKSIQFPDEGEMLDISIGRENQMSMLFIRDDANQLHSLDLNNENAGFKHVASSVVTLGQNINCVYSVVLKEQGTKIEINWYLGNNPDKLTLDIIPPKQISQVFVHGSGGWSKSCVGSFAFENDNDIWTIVSGYKAFNKFDVSINPNDKVLGVICVDVGNFNNIQVAKYNGQLALIVLKPDAKSIHVVWNEGDELITLLEHEFVSGELNPQHLLLHYINSDNDIVVVNLQSEKIVFRLDQSTET